MIKIKIFQNFSSFIIYSFTYKMDEYRSEYFNKLLSTENIKKRWEIYN